MENSKQPTLLQKLKDDVIGRSIKSISAETLTQWLAENTDIQDAMLERAFVAGRDSDITFKHFRNAMFGTENTKIPQPNTLVLLEWTVSNDTGYSTSYKVNRTLGYATMQNGELVFKSARYYGTIDPASVDSWAYVSEHLLFAWLEGIGHKRIIKSNKHKIRQDMHELLTIATNCGMFDNEETRYLSRTSSRNMTSVELIKPTKSKALTPRAKRERLDDPTDFLLEFTPSVKYDRVGRRDVLPQIKDDYRSALGWPALTQLELDKIQLSDLYITSKDVAKYAQMIELSECSTEYVDITHYDTSKHQIVVESEHIIPKRKNSIMMSGKFCYLSNTDEFEKNLKPKEILQFVNRFENFPVSVISFPDPEVSANYYRFNQYDVRSKQVKRTESSRRDENHHHIVNHKHFINFMNVGSQIAGEFSLFHKELRRNNNDFYCGFSEPTITKINYDKSKVIINTQLIRVGDELFYVYIDTHDEKFIATKFDHTKSFTELYMDETLTYGKRSEYTLEEFTEKIRLNNRQFQKVVLVSEIPLRLHYLKQLLA